MHRKLRSRRGETLVETLAAILIVTLSSMALLAMLSAAARINTAAGAADAAFRTALTAAESRAAALEGGPVELTVDAYSYDVHFYGEAADPDAGEAGLRAYALAPEGGTGP